MNKPKMTYFEKADVLHLVIFDELESDSLELNSNVTGKLNETVNLSGLKF